MKTTINILLLLALAIFWGSGCSTAKVTSERKLTTSGVAKPAMVYVADFELAAENIKRDAGVLSGRPGPVGRVGERLSGGSTDPVYRAREIIDLMADSLVKQLAKSGFSSVRLRAPMAIPTDGWLVRGIFTEVQEGNRLRRAMIGLGQGQTDIQLVVTIHDLSKGPPTPLYEIATDATSGNQPGAAPTIILGPYGAAARFVMSGSDLEKNVKQTAEQIAQRMAKQIQQSP